MRSRRLCALPQDEPNASRILMLVPPVAALWIPLSTICRKCSESHYYNKVNQQQSILGRRSEEYDFRSRKESTYMYFHAGQ